MILREFLKSELLILDGAMGTQVQSLELSDQDFGGSEYKMLSDLLSFSKPKALKKIHQTYFQAGAHAVETNTFGASALRLSEYDFKNLDISGFSEKAQSVDWQKNDYLNISYELSLYASQIACKARDEEQKNGEKPLFVMGSLGPSNSVLSSTQANLKKSTYSKIIENFYHQSLGLVDGGVDALLFETMQDPLETKAAIHGGQLALKKRNKNLPIIAQVTVDAFSKMQIFNTDILAVLTMLQGTGIDVFGINCSIGPDLMQKTVQTLARYSQVPISVVPNAGLPVSVDGKTVFKLSPQDLARHLEIFVKEYGVNMVGGCCGTTPEHIAEISKLLKNVKPSSRQVEKKIFLSGPQNAVEWNSKDNLIRIAERLNARGSKKVRVAVEEADSIRFEVLEDVVQEQVEDLGVPLIDICMDSNVVKTEKVLVDVIQKITTDFSGAMCLDSFSVEALLKAIEVYPGRTIINSISLEEYEKGKDKIDCVVPQTLNHDPMYMALCTGPEGPGETCAQKFDLAKQIYEKTLSLGVRPDQLIFDVNAFPIGSESKEGLNFAVETLEAIKKVKTLHSDVQTSLGVGNLTTGLGKKPYMRTLLTSVFLHEARQKGLDAAIINPHHYVPIESLDPDDVKKARIVIFEHDMDVFSELEDIAEKKKSGIQKKKAVYDDLSLEEAICQKIKDGFKSRKNGSIQNEVLKYDYQDTIVKDVAIALEKHEPLKFINDYLMKAMQELGDGFGRGEVSLPHLLKSADVMKQAMGYIEAYMKSLSGEDIHESVQYKATIVLGTVFQDVHSIGKDLVKTLFENYGYRVIDLGVQTPLEDFIAAVKKYNAKALGLSALLVQTSNHMITIAKMLKDEGLEHVDLLIGGAPVNWRHASYVSLHGQKDFSKLLPNVFYCSSGMDGVNMMNQLLESDEKRQTIYKDNHEKLKWHFEYAEKKQAEEKTLFETLPKRTVEAYDLKNKDPFFAPKVWTPELSELVEHLDLNTLFSLNWRYGRKSSWDKKGVSEEILKNKLLDWVEKCSRYDWLVPHAVYAVLPCLANGDSVELLHPRDHKTRVGVLEFNEVIGGSKVDRFSVAQYFQASQNSLSAIGLQITTSGNQVERKIAEFKKKGDSESAYLLQGLSDRVAEDLAEVVHNKMRGELKLEPKQGQRYSPGYPALKEIRMNAVLAKALNALHLLPMGMTDAHEFTPTGTTGAVVCFHPKAGYE